MSSIPPADAVPTEPVPSDATAEATTPDAAAAPAADAAPSPAQTGARLAELFPALFAGAPKPLKLRIQADIQERAPGVFSKQALSAFLRRHTGATGYLVATTKATHRFDLDGQPAGELSDEHRKIAADELARRRALREARREEELKGRRERAALLRDFERTTLTEANFCALKGIEASQLAALLAQAREEAKEDAARAPARPDHRGERGPRGERPGQRRDGRGDGRRDGPRDGRGPRRDGAPAGPRGKERAKP
ncbi:prop effector ProQ [Aquabacterium fontiphilum]|jgi:septal ring factor EnvC (AmiA/AmiB activator)|uniref:ProQ/FINO family protein n=1 Tax=Aquabacterium fontiphilum TaxID=450365 RepID=UPI0013776D6A|nr:ProQ/FINO family protein [Aquabacterium fontiphilum]NBD21728.1 prop effector ProQ [Aquabacterium fontiphilum]